MKQSLAFHVERAATVDRIVLDDAGERIDFPRSRFGSDDVHVTEQDYGTFRTVAFETRDDVCAPGLVLEDLVLNAVLIEDLLQKLRRLELVAGRIRSVDAQILLHQIDGHVLIAWPVNSSSILSRNSYLKHKDEK